MAINCTITNERNGQQYDNAHVVIRGFIEITKGNYGISLAAWRSKQDYLDKLPSITSFQVTASVNELAGSGDFRARIYTHLMTLPEFVNPVADMNDDFPVTPIG